MPPIEEEPGRSPAHEGPRPSPPGTGPGLRRRTREVREREELAALAPAACPAAASRGRQAPEHEDPYRTAFERDRDRILHAKAFRRLKHKTQVFLNPDGDHFVTRLTHTLHVAQVGRSIAAALGLNEALTEAICLGHDIGHAPFGHTGEEALTPYVEGEWQHAIHGVRVVAVLEPLNLTWEVRDGIRQSSWRNAPEPATAEGMACRFADRIAYLCHDVQDAIRAGVVAAGDVPPHLRRSFGEPGRAWIETMVGDVLEASTAAGEVTMRPDRLEAMTELRAWMFDHVYLRREAREHSARAVRVIRDLVDHFVARPEQVPEATRRVGDSATQAAVDHVAGMSDKFAIRCHDALYRPAGLY